MFGEGTLTLEDVTFSQPLFLAEGRSHAVELVLEAEASGRSAFQFYQAPAGDDPKGAWTLHASGAVRRSHDEAPPQPWCAALAEVQARCSEEFDWPTCYRKLSERGLDYGPAFQVIERAWKRPGEAVARVALSEAVAARSARYVAHPALLDGCLQAVAAAVPEDFIRAGSGDTYLAAGVKRLRLQEPPEGELWMHARLTTDLDKEGGDYLEGDLQLRDAAGRVFLEMEGLSFRRLAKSAGREAKNALPDWLYEVRWLEREPAAAVETAPPGWLIFADTSGVGDKLAGLLRSRGHRCVLASPGAICMSGGATTVISSTRKPPLVSRGCWRTRPRLA